MSFQRHTADNTLKMKMIKCKTTTAAAATFLFSSSSSCRNVKRRSHHKRRQLLVSNIHSGGMAMWTIDDGNLPKSPRDVPVAWSRGYHSISCRATNKSRVPRRNKLMLTTCRLAKSSDDDDSTNGSHDDSNEQKVGFTTSSLSGTATANPTGIVDSILSVLISDKGSIVLGLIGVTVCLLNRLSHIDDAVPATIVGQQSRADLLAVLATGAVLLNGITKLDVTSALAETVILDGTKLDGAVISDDHYGALSGKCREDVIWAMESTLDATPAETAVLMMHTEGGEGTRRWKPMALTGIVPSNQRLWKDIPMDVVRSTPILDRFLRSSDKETYLPSLQALPGKVEFTYLPPNTQEALLLPVKSSFGDQDQREGAGEKEMQQRDTMVLVLGSDTARSFTPRDVAWCRVLASRIGTMFDS